MTGACVRSWMATARVISRNLRQYKFEPEVAFLKDMIRPKDVCLHVGASDGRHSLIMARLAEQGHVYCFEPSGYSFNILRRVLAFHRPVLGVKALTVKVAGFGQKVLEHIE